MNEARAAVLRADVLTEGHFVFADGAHATAKLEMDNLWEHPHELDHILRLLAHADGLPPADVIIGVPRGGQRLAIELNKRGLVHVPVARLERIPGGAKQDFRFLSNTDREIAERAASVRIYEDVVTTMSSIAGVVRLLDPVRQTIHSLAIWRRDEPKAEYRRHVTDHYLVEEYIPNYRPDQCPVCSVDR